MFAKVKVWVALGYIFVGGSVEFAYEAELKVAQEGWSMGPVM